MATGRPKKYAVRLTEEEKQALQGMLSKGVHAARKLNRARVLLCADEGLTLDQISERAGVCRQSVSEICRRFATEGLKASLEERPRSGRPPLITSSDEAELIMIASQEAPEGRQRWTLRMIADRFVELHPDKHISHEAVRGILKRVTSSHGSRRLGPSLKRKVRVS
jgi:transposase